MHRQLKGTYTFNYLKIKEMEPKNIEEKKVQIIYCACGQSVNRVIALEVERTPSEKAAVTKEVNAAKSFGIKTDIITLAEFRKLPFLTCTH